MSILRISLFGYVEIAHDDWPADVKIPRIAQALLVYLLLERHRLHPRETLLNLFWGDYNEKKARKCLSTTLWRLRSVLEPEDIPKGTYLLTTSAGEIGFNLESVHWLDVAVFEEIVKHTLKKNPQSVTAADVQKLEQTLDLYTNDLLEGFYDDWALRERERFRELYLSVLEYLMHYFKQQGAYEQSLAYGQKILNCDPLRESIYRIMVRLYWKNGQSAKAIRQYRLCHEILATELNIAPMEETQKLYSQIVADIGHPAETPVKIYETSSGLQQALQQLYLAKQELGRAQVKLDQAMNLVEQVTNHSHAHTKGCRLE